MSGKPKQRKRKYHPNWGGKRAKAGRPPSITDKRTGIIRAYVTESLELAFRNYCAKHDLHLSSILMEAMKEYLRNRGVEV